MSHRYHMLLTLLLVGSGLSVGETTTAEERLQLVDPFIGTGFHGHSSPGRPCRLVWFN